MMDRILLCTDLDRTLIPNGTPIESLGARKYFAQLTARDEITLVYVSGRDKGLITKAIQEYGLPWPHYAIGDVGATMYMLASNTRLQDTPPWPAWSEEIAPSWAGHTHYDLKQLFNDLEGLQLQEDSKQNTYKLSYNVPLGANRIRLLRILRKRLEDVGVKTNLIWSVDEHEQTYLLDILPARAGKYHAIDFLRRHLDFSIKNTLFAGDSGNDLEVLVSPIHAVLVANSTKKIQTQARRLAKQKHRLDALYLAKGGFMGMNGNYSAGILEGIAHYLPQTRVWMGPA